ncbi:MAG: hypothetical protein IJ072_00185 [Oscillospiraceae bacterium]|nr:hypothetical protein [Oscillospiraceae bacterium]
MREAYNAEREHTVVGTYPSIKGMQLGGAADSSGVSIVPETPRFYRPIPTYENFKMLFRGETPYWIPNNGWFGCDVNEFRPRQAPDCLPHHQCIDGGDYIDYSKLPKVQRGWFDLPLEWEEAAMGASVRPGNPLLPDMNDWESLKWPDLDAIDWEGMEEMNRDYLSTDKANQLGIHLGLWERMMCLMDVNNAALALADEDQEDAVHAFLDKLSDTYCEYISRVSKIGRIDSVMLHDDWGHQRGPFFSLETAMKFFVKPMKKVVDHCHSLDIVFEHHCCGCAQKLVPAMVACGTDFWFPQSAINDVDQLIHDFKDDHITFSVSSPVLPVGSSEAEIRKIAYDFVEKYKDAGILMCQDVSKNGMPGHDPSLYPIFADGVYEYSRKAYQNAPDPSEPQERIA